MSEYQQIVDGINTILLSETETSVDDLSSLHGQYIAAVKEMNRRLRECGDRLQKGHRAEAIQLCEAEPNLLDSVGTLDFPERDVWVEYVRQYDLPAPPQLLIDVAGEVSEAYSAEQPLASLMRLHRLHALARSPLPRRIEVMRKIARRDGQNPIWEGDLREYERVRVNQVLDEVEQAGKRTDITCLAVLEKELRSPDWLQPPPAALLQRTIELHTRVRTMYARAELEKLAKVLSLAHADLDVERGREIREHWNARAAIGITQATDPLVELVAPALEWLEKEDEQERARAEYDVALGGLQRALDEGANRGKLDRLYHAVARHEWGVPPVLQQRLAERIRYLELAAKRRSVLVLVSVVLGVLLLAGLTAGTLFYQLHRREVTTHAAALAALIEDKKLTEAETYLADIEGKATRIFRSAEIQKLRGELDVALSDERGRKKQLDELLKAIKRTLDGDVTWESLSQAAVLLQDAEKTSRSSEEKAQVKQFELELPDKQGGLQKEVDDQFTKALAELRNRVTGVQANDRDSIEKLVREAKDLQGRPHVSPELQGQVSPLIARLTALVDQHIEATKEVSRLHDLTTSVGSRDRYRLALETYAREFADRPRSLHFKRIAEQESETWKGMELWDTLVQKWSQEDLRYVEPAKAAVLLEEAKKLLGEQKGFPAAGVLEELLLHLEAVTHRADPTSHESIHLKLMEPLNNPTVSDLCMVESRDGKKYFFRDKPLPVGSNWSIRYFKGFDLSDKARVVLASDNIMNPAAGDGFDWTSPQTKFSRFALDKLARLGQSSWEATFHAILTDLYEQKQMEPILKVQLMRRVLDVACQGSHCLVKAFEKDLNLIKNTPLDEEANWLAPENPQAKTAREAAQRILEQARNPREACREAATEFGRLNRPVLGQRYSWIGWLYQAQPDLWTCVIPSGLAEKKSAELFVAYRLSADLPVKLDKIGELCDGKVVLGSPEKTALVEGRPVYASSRGNPR